MVESIVSVGSVSGGPAALLAAASELAGGGYHSWVKILFMFLVPLPLYFLAPLMHKDAAAVHIPQAPWCGAILGAAIFGMLLWLLLPVYAVGLLLYLVLTTGVMAAYVVYRNSRAPEGQKIFTAEHLAGLLKSKTRTVVAPTDRLKLYTWDSRIHLPPAEKATAQEVLVYNAVQDLLYDLAWRRASQADITPGPQGSRVRFMIDGVVSERPALAPGDSEAIVEFLKPLAGMEAAERRRPQHGKVSVDLAGAAIDIELSTAGTTSGQRMQFRVVQEVVQTDLSLLGLSPDVLEKARVMNHAGHGILLVSGRAGNGVTSTLYSLLREHDAFVKQLNTLEATPDVDIENITQNAYGEPVKLPGMLGSVLRRDPDVLMLDACPDGETAHLTTEAAGEKTFLIGMRAGDAFTALAKWIQIVGDARTATGKLRGVLCQILLRKLCPTCREAYRPDPAMLAKINLPADRIDRFYRPPTKPLVDEKGNPRTCPTCQSSGYHGRTAAFELLEMTDELRQLVAEGASISQIKAACRKNKMLYLQEQAIRKVIEGQTSIQEVIRVSRKPKKN